MQEEGRERERDRVEQVGEREWRESKGRESKRKRDGDRGKEGVSRMEIQERE